MTRVADPPPINPDSNAPGPLTPCAQHPVAPNPEKPVKSEGVESNNAPEA